MAPPLSKPALDADLKVGAVIRLCTILSHAQVRDRT